MKISRPIGVVVPNLSIAIEGPIAVPVEMHIRAAEVPRGGLILESDGEGVRKPVRYIIIVPAQGPFELDVHIMQTGRVHDGEDVVSCVLEDDVAVLPTTTERPEDRWRIVFAWVVVGGDNAGPAASPWGWPGMIESHIGRAFLDDRGLPAVVFS